MTTAEAQEKLRSDDDFVYLPRFDCSLEKLMLRYPDGVPGKLIAQALMMTEDETDALFQATLVSLRKALKVSAP